jgi:hypothetical protein
MKNTFLAENRKPGDKDGNQDKKNYTGKMLNKVSGRFSLFSFFSLYELQ